MDIECVFSSLFSTFSVGLNRPPGWTLGPDKLLVGSAGRPAESAASWSASRIGGVLCRRAATGSITSSCSSAPPSFGRVVRRAAQLGECYFINLQYMLYYLVMFLLSDFLTMLRVLLFSAILYPFVPVYYLLFESENSVKHERKLGGS